MKVKPQEPVLLTNYSWLGGTQGRIQGEEIIMTGRLLNKLVIRNYMTDNQQKKIIQYIKNGLN